MPNTSKANKASNSSKEDRISALPDDVIHHVLGFLQAAEAVHTSVLARRWRYLWKSMRCLRVNSIGRWEEGNGASLSNFMNCLLLLRDPGSTLDEVEIKYDNLEDETKWISIWIRHALSCQAQVLTVKPDSHMYICLDGPPLVSRQLRRLEFSNVNLKHNFLDFSSCTALEDLKIEGSALETSRILSPSLKHMSIKQCAFRHDGRIRISVPNLVSLQLISLVGRTPLLESMLSLETAVVIPRNYSDDLCREGVAGECCGTCADCCGNDDHNGGCVLLGGLSCATNLELIAYLGMLIFRRDLRWCPTFSKLKTLLLNKWCVQINLHALVCMLEHSPVLENLILQLRKQEETALALEVEGNNSLMHKPAAISGCLKIIKVKFDEIDDRVCKVLKFLSILGTEIIIQRTTDCWRY
ncbi:MEIOTIC F-BOX protein MOF isoform X1 [Lolium perenne]|uniref:MEIOTIC F-BOX protein MOF isoform X1 n=1 Tax=Lolium perenne TaxID=4522 RepID=UPI0021F6397F|nr:F-box/LRR-repeat protein At1g55660-like isoform X1 [Lolium perenne]